jgi:hypothetical protein
MPLVLGASGGDEHLRASSTILEASRSAWQCVSAGLHKIENPITGMGEDAAYVEKELDALRVLRRL